MVFWGLSGLIFTILLTLILNVLFGTGMKFQKECTTKETEIKGLFNFKGLNSDSVSIFVNHLVLDSQCHAPIV